MNKRQAKKQFKKLYGYNPNQLLKVLDEFSENISHTVDILCKGMEKMGGKVEIWGRK